MSKRNEKGTENMEDTAVQPTDGDTQGQQTNAEATKNQAMLQEQIKDSGSRGNRECPGQVSYEINCRNKVSKNIGGVDFINGVGHTTDGFKASWFANKEGYKVEKDT